MHQHRIPRRRRVDTGWEVEIELYKNSHMFHSGLPRKSDKDPRLDLGVFELTTCQDKSRGLTQIYKKHVDIKYVREVYPASVTFAGASRR